MAGPIVYISHNRVKPGQLEPLVQFYLEQVKIVHADKPGTLVYLGYVNEDGTEVTFVHVFPDAEAFDRHMQAVPERVKVAFQLMEPRRLELYGMPSQATLEQIKKLVGAGVALSHDPQYVGGFVRSAANS